MVGSHLKELVSPPSGIQGIKQSGLTVKGGRYGTKGIGVLNSLFLTVWKQPIGQCQVARCLGLAVGPGSWVHCPWGFPGDFLPVIQRGESKPLRGGFQRERTIKLSINMRLK